MSSDDSEMSESETVKTIKSKGRYIHAYESFISWQKDKRTCSFHEDVLLVYFEEMAAKYKPSSLWSFYSMLKFGLKCKHNVNIKKYKRLKALLKHLSKGFVSKKKKALSLENVEKFIDEAPDHEYLATKVALIFGVLGGLKQQDLTEITTENLDNQGEVLVVNLPKTNERLCDSFVIQGKYCQVVRKYQSLRAPNVTTTRFFQQYRRGKCCAQFIGKNSFGRMPKEIARFLNLPDPSSFTGLFLRKGSTSEESASTPVVPVQCPDNLKNDADSSTQSQSASHHRQPANHHHQPANHHHQPPPVPVQRRERIVEQQHWANEQCRFCGVFKECSPVTQKPYFMGNKVSLTLNHLRVELDFSIESLPKTVCEDCNKKLLETFEFIKQVNAAQFSLVPVSPNTNAFSVNNMAHCFTSNDINIDVVKAEFESDDEYNDESKVRESSFKFNETIFLKETHKTPKRKNKEVDKNKTQKKKKVKDKIKYNKESDIDVQQCEFIMDIKEEIVDLDDSNGEESSGEDEMDTAVKPSELEHSDTDYDYRIGNETANGETSKISSDAQCDDND